MSKQPADFISAENADQSKLFYFVANVVPYRQSDGRCLILKRDESEKVHPGRWTVPGGKLEHADLDVDNPDAINGIVKDYNNAMAELAARETREECGLEITGELRYLMSKAFIRPDGVPVVLIKFAASIADDNAPVVVEQGAFTDYAWVNADEVHDYECIDGVVDEVATTIREFSH